MIPLATPDLSGNEAAYLQQCIETTFVSTVGPFVNRFENLVAEASGTRHAIATSSGTTGLHLALVALDVAHDDLVLLPSFTFIASANAIAHCGAMPWLIDIDPATWTMDPDQLASALEGQTERTGRGLLHRATGRRVAAIMPVHTLGLPAEMDRITEIAHRYSLPVVADSAAALGATDKGRPVGALGAALSVFSFNGNKTVTSGGGGAVAGNDEALLALARHLSTTARSGANYLHDRIGFNYRMTNLDAAVGCAQMERLDHLVGAKRRIRTAYDAAFSDIEGLAPFPSRDGCESGCWLSGVVLDHGRATRMEAIRAALREDGIDARPFWQPVHLQPPYAGAPHEDCTVSEDLWPRILTLPCSTHLTDADQDHVIAAVRKALA